MGARYRRGQVTSGITAQCGAPDLRTGGVVASLLNLRYSLATRWVGQELGIKLPFYFIEKSKEPGAARKLLGAHGLKRVPHLKFPFGWATFPTKQAALTLAAGLIGLPPVADLSRHP